MLRNGRVALVILALLASGCSPGSNPESVSGYDTVLTFYADNADFPHAFTFALVDTVMHLVEQGGSDTITREYDELILTRVRADMLAQGWTEIAAPDSAHPPDVAVQVGVTTSDYVGVAYWPPYWGWYPGWGYPGYGWGYYPTYSYTTGTVLVAMLDLRNPDPVAESLPVMWLAAVSGVASTTSSNQTRIVSGIDQAFEQSPYLRK
jgi:hypothetical protein